MSKRAAVPIELRRLTKQADPTGPNSKNDIGTGIAITWSDQAVSEIDAVTLRKQCPCASCREARGEGSHSKPLGGGKSMLKVVSATVEQETDLRELWQVGNYAIGMSWADGHDSGIYQYEFLRLLAETPSKTSS